MKELALKVKAIANRIVAKKGQPFTLVAVVIRDDAPNVWDVLFSAPWLDSHRPQSLQFLSEQLNHGLSKRQLLLISRIAIIEAGSPILLAFQRAVHIENGIAEFENCSFDGLALKHAYVLWSTREGVPAESS